MCIYLSEIVPSLNDDDDFEEEEEEKAKITRDEVSFDWRRDDRGNKKAASDRTEWYGEGNVPR